MADSPMVIVWPSRDVDSAFGSVTLSQCKLPYETMPTPDPNPPLAAKLSLSHTSVTGKHPQIAFIRRVSRSLIFLFWVYFLVH
ncbi:hypothetical protein EDB85DRAFT_1986474 [Lactarius pseudohatsudake]|nr:hypothetical protein EDB85DRAFT_1986474 [Lactarius pseudohatsudake]